MTEPWLDRKRLADQYSCSVRSVEEAIADGLPGAVIFGRKKFKVSTVEPWLIERGFIREVDDRCTVVTGSGKRGGDRGHGPAP